MALRNVTEEDLPLLFEHQQDPQAARMACVTARDREAFMQHWRMNVLPDPSVTKKAIVIAGEVTGNIQSWNQQGKRLVGYWLGRAFWGRGIASAALAELVFVHEPNRPLHAFVATSNRGSMRVLEKCGFEPLGDAVIAADGVEELLMRLR